MNEYFVGTKEVVRNSNNLGKPAPASELLRRTETNNNSNTNTNKLHKSIEPLIPCETAKKSPPA